jgi:hypothetical protein
MNTFLNGMKTASNYTRTENGALTHKSIMDGLMDLFAMGAAYRSRTDEDVMLLFKNAFDENPVYALKCLFYIRDIRGGQGERRFFRVATKYLASYDTNAMRRNLQYVPEFGRWDDLFVFIGTPLENDALNIIKHQLALDVQCKTPSLLGKWMPSENTSSQKTRKTAAKVRKFIGMTPKQYRKTLSVLRARINVLERLMSEGRWDEIEFDKIPSKAGLKYKNAFARHDIERMKRNPEVKTYETFAKDTETKVNAKALYPYEVVAKALTACHRPMDHTDRLMVNKYWENLADYFQGKTFNGLAVVDTSASMTWRGGESCPLNVAISLGLYCAERANGPFANHYVSFSRTPRLIETNGVDFCDKVYRIYRTNLCENTNIEATFDMLLQTALNNGCGQDELPQNIIVISDMEFDQGTAYMTRNNAKTLMENIREKWARHGYRMPHLIYWNVDARQNNIPEDMGCGLISYVSGMSPSIFEQILSGKTGYELMKEKLDSPRYSVIH